MKSAGNFGCALLGVLLAGVVPTGRAATPPFSVVSSLQPSDPTQMGRPLDNFVPSDWSSVKNFPGATNLQIPIHYQTFSVHVGSATFLQIIVDDPNDQVFAAAYLDSYDPANLSGNYLGDAGVAGNTFGNPAFFQVLAQANHDVIVVVAQSGLIGQYYGKFTLSVEAYGDVEFNPPTPPPGAPTLISPADGSTQVPLTANLSWNAASGAASYDVYLGTSATPALVTNQTALDYSPGTLLPLTKYYWQIASRNAGGTALSPIASFTTLGPQINSGGISSAAGPITSIARGELATIYGADFTPAGITGQAQVIPFPLALAQVSVTVGGVAAPMYYVNSTQIDFQVPFEVTGSKADVVVTANNVVSAPMSVTIADYAIGVFGYFRTAQSYDPIIVHLDNSLVSPSSPAAPGETLVIYATGIGKLTNPVTTGAGAPGSPFASAVDTPTVTIGGGANAQPAQAGQVLFAGLSPGSVGLAQIDVTLPTTLLAQDAPLVIQFPGDTSAAVTLYLTPPVSGSARKQ
jgi:uncharacterized protein (TIGR03437 family)